MKALAVLCLISGLLLMAGAIAFAVWGYLNPEPFRFGRPSGRFPSGYYLCLVMIFAGAFLIRAWAKRTDQWIGPDD